MFCASQRAGAGRADGPSAASRIALSDQWSDMRDSVRGLTAQLYIHYFPPPPAGVAQHLRYLSIHKVSIQSTCAFSHRAIKF